MLRTIEANLIPSPHIGALIDPPFRLLTNLIFIIGGMGHSAGIA